MRILRVNRCRAQALQFYSGEAEMFLWLGGTFENGWRIRETSTGELVSILYGSYTSVKSVALDPSPKMAAETLRQLSVGRTGFISWFADRPCSFSLRTGARYHPRGLAGRP